MEHRNGKGQFTQGNQASRGRGRHRQGEQKAYLQATFGRITLADWKLIVDRAKEDAKKGDARARQWLGDYLLGKPPQILELRGAEAALLADVLDRLAARGMSAADVFQAMLQEMALGGDDE